VLPGISSSLVGVDQPGYESRKRRKQHYAAYQNSKAKSVAALALELVPAEKPQHTNAYPMAYNVNNKIENNIHAYFYDLSPPASTPTIPPHTLS